MYYGSHIHFKCNHIGIINVFINDAPKSCNGRCLFENFRGINNNTSLRVATSPKKLKLYNPAKFITGNDVDYDTYYMSNIMLGQEFALDACLLDYYDQPTEVKELLITSMSHHYYNITGLRYVSVSCNHTTKPVLSVIGNMHSKNSYNYSIMISLYATHNSDTKLIAAKLIVELSQCHPGFWYSSGSKKCECYNNKDIISCSGSNSTIKRGYWFGTVAGKPTVTTCPNDYCDFTCCKNTNDIFHLSPSRAKQCRLHRSSTACGNCEKGYTLSFDSPECIEVNRYTIGQTILVIVLSLLYWIAAVVVVFVMTYFKVTIGSLYGIVYYYSVVDILLSQILYISNGLHATVSITCPVWPS